MFRQKILSSSEAIAVEFVKRKNANYASNNGIYIKRDNGVRTKRIVLDLHDVIVDSKKVVLF